MFSIKHTMSAVFIVSTSIALAGQMGSEISQVIPSNKVTAWDVGGKAIFLKPSINDMRDANARTVTVATGQSSVLSRSIDYSWGFSLNGAYHYTDTDDINLNWYHLRAPYNNTYENLAGTPTTIKIDPQWDAANLEFGKQISLDEQKNIRLHAGAQYARLSIGVIETNATGTTDNGLALAAVSLNGTPTYNGFGPRFGADFTYHWGHGVRIYANVATAILAGTSKYSKNYITNSGSPSITNASSTLVVPEMDAKLGAAYTHAMGSGQITVDAGWMFFDYWNVLNQEDVANISAVQTTNFGAQGPYVGMKWVGFGG